MGKMNIAIVIGISREGNPDVLHLGKPSELSSALQDARRMHDEYSEIRTYTVPSRVEKTRKDLPDVRRVADLEGSLPPNEKGDEGKQGSDSGANLNAGAGDSEGGSDGGAKGKGVLAGVKAKLGFKG